MAKPITPLRSEFEGIVDSVREEFGNALCQGKTATSPWAFWAKWYAAARAGDHLPWELQAKIAQIPNDIWESGPEAVAKEIAQIEKWFDLREKLAAAEKEIVRSHAQRLGIGGNDPPDAINDLPEVPKVLEIIWEPFAELKEEVEAEKPDAGRIRAAISKLVALLASCGEWVGGKLDAGATEYVKAIGKWGGGATTVWIASHQPQINAVLVAAKEWLVALLG